MGTSGCSAEVEANFRFCRVCVAGFHGGDKGSKDATSRYLGFGIVVL